MDVPNMEETGPSLRYRVYVIPQDLLNNGISRRIPPKRLTRQKSSHFQAELGSLDIDDKESSDDSHQWVKERLEASQEEIDMYPLVKGQDISHDNPDSSDIQNEFPTSEMEEGVPLIKNIDPRWTFYQTNDLKAIDIKNKPI